MNREISATKADDNYICRRSAAGEMTYAAKTIYADGGRHTGQQSYSSFVHARTGFMCLSVAGVAGGHVYDSMHV